MSNRVSRLLARARSLFGREGRQMRRDPDFRAMSGAQLHEFLRSLEPAVSAAEIEDAERRLYPRIVARIHAEKQRARRRRKRRCLLVIVILCALLLFGVVGQALRIPLWSTMTEWTEEHFIMTFIPSSGAVMGPDESQQSVPESVREVWGEEVWEVLSELEAPPALPTWRPEQFQLDRVEVHDIFGRLLIIVLYLDEDENTLMLTVEELPLDDPDYSLNFEINPGSVTEEVRDGMTYCYSENMDRFRVVWQPGRTMVSISVQNGEEEVRKMVDSIQ